MASAVLMPDGSSGGVTGSIDGSLPFASTANVYNRPGACVPHRPVATVTYCTPSIVYVIGLAKPGSSIADHSLRPLSAV